MNTRKLLLTLSAALLPLCGYAAEPASPTGTTKHVKKVAHKASRKVAPPVVEPASEPVVTEQASDEHKLAVAQQVHTGRLACELGAHVTVTPDSGHVGGFVVQLASHVFHMSPVVSSTGAVRLEDAKNGAMWLQLGNKSMLMSTKLGQRLADECQSPAQVAVAEKLKNNPPPSLLDDAPGVTRK